MRAYLISDNIDTQVGMRLAGIEGVIVHEREEVLKEIDNASRDNEIGVILLTERIASLVRGEINNLKLHMSRPLIVEIPDRHGTRLEKDRITKYIKESIGIKI